MTRQASPHGTVKCASSECIQNRQNKMTQTTPQITQLLQQGIALHQRGRLQEAQAFYVQILKQQPHHFDALQLLGTMAAQTQNHEQAVGLLTRALEVNPQHAPTYNNRGLVLQELRQFDAAIASYDCAVAIKPDYVEAYSNRGNALAELKRFGEAIASYDNAIAINPDYAQAHYNRGNALQALRQTAAAIASYDSAIAIAPDFAEVHCNRGNALQALKQLDAAVASYNNAIAINRNFAQAHYNLGNALQELKQPGAAITRYDNAIAIRPDFAEAHYNRGSALRELNLLDAAIASYDKAITIKPDYAEVYCSRGFALKDQKKLDAAIASFEKAISIDANLPFAIGELVHTKMIGCDWKNIDALYQSVFDGVSQRKECAEPFGYQGICDDEASLKLSAEIYTLVKYPKQEFSHVARQKNKKIKIGYLGGEFRNQATSILMIELWELHNKDLFEIIALDNGESDESPMRKRIERAFDEIIDITKMSDHQVAVLINNKNIDILLNLNGFFGKARQGVFACKPAPIQINYLGFPGTIGAEYIDYIIVTGNSTPL